ncbi:MAG: hypothetical protein GY809_13515 [Planctomycetes bacterium]|nr:hypothetical protein [Planctomycetota bacterium]
MTSKLYGLIILSSCVTCCSASDDDLRGEFVNPPLKYATRLLWLWNNITVTEAGIVEQMQAARDKCGYGILPFGKAFSPTYLTDEYSAMYHVALEQYTKGINQSIPHAVWYDDSKVTFKLELSWRHEKYAGKLKQYNTTMSRLNLVLQNHGRHVADMAVLAPLPSYRPAITSQFVLAPQGP